MLQAACEASGASHVVGEVTFPLAGPEQLLEVVAGSLPQGAKLAVFDAGELLLKLEAMLVLNVKGLERIVDKWHSAVCNKLQSWQWLLPRALIACRCPLAAPCHVQLLAFQSVQ
jgi:hypothetical protein